MANIRNLKKDIDYLCSEIVSDCYIYMHFNPDKNYDKVVGIMSEAVELRNELVHQINNPIETEDKKELRNHYKTIGKNLLTSVDKLFSSLSDLSK